jgi:hypothetical protein
MDKVSEAALAKAGFRFERQNYGDGYRLYRRVSGDREDYVKVYFATQTVDWHSYFPLEGIPALLTPALTAEERIALDQSINAAHYRVEPHTVRILTNLRDRLLDRTKEATP